MKRKFYFYNAGRQPLNDGQQRAYDAVMEFRKRQLRMPRPTELADFMGVGVQYAQSRMNELCGRGWLRRVYQRRWMEYVLVDDDVLAE